MNKKFVVSFLLMIVLMTGCGNNSPHIIGEDLNKESISVTVIEGNKSLENKDNTTTDITPNVIITNAPTITTTPTVTDAPTITATPTVTNAPTITATPIVTNEPTVTATPIVTNEPAITATPTVTNAPTITATPSVTNAPTITAAPTVTATPSVTNEPIITATPIPSHTHNWVTDWLINREYNGNCDWTYTYAYKICSECGEVTDTYDRHQLVHSTEGEWIEIVTEAAHDCTHGTLFYRQCNSCGTCTEIFQKGDAFDHSWGEWCDDEGKTCLSNGHMSTHRTCSVCGTNETSGYWYNQFEYHNYQVTGSGGYSEFNICYNYDIITCTACGSTYDDNLTTCGYDDNFDGHCDTCGGAVNP